MIFTGNIKNNPTGFLALAAVMVYLTKKGKDVYSRGRGKMAAHSGENLNSFKSGGSNTCRFVSLTGMSAEDADSSIHDDGIYDMDMECLSRKRPS